MLALPEMLRELGGRVVVLRRNQLRQHLDDRHLGAEAAEDRGELAADDAAAEHDEPAWHLRLGEQAGRVDAARRVEALDRRAQREGACRDDRALEAHVLPTLDRDRVRVLEAAGALHPLDAVGLEEAGDARGHLLDDPGLPLVRGREVELRRPDLDAELAEGLLGFLDRERGLHPGFRRDAADAKARAPELGLLLDADGLGAKLCGADRSRVAAGPAAEDGNVTVHGPDPIGRAAAAREPRPPTAARPRAARAATRGRSVHRQAAAARRWARRSR